jgi:hypothetical protein
VPGTGGGKQQRRAAIASCPSPQEPQPPALPSTSSLAQANLIAETELLVEPVLVEDVLVAEEPFVAGEASIGVLRLVAEEVLVDIRLDRSLEQQLTSGAAVGPAERARQHERHDRAIGARPESDPKIDLAHGEHQAERVARQHRQVKIADPLDRAVR